MNIKKVKSDLDNKAAYGNMQLIIFLCDDQRLTGSIVKKKRTFQPLNCTKI